MKGERAASASRAVETDLRVRYSETDQMGIVYNAHYLVWFEIGRTEWCRAAGLPYAAMEESGLFIPVTRVEASFRRRSRYDDRIRVSTRMTDLAARGCTFAYAVRNPAEEVLAEGATRHVFTDSAGRPLRASDRVVSLLDGFRSSAPSEEK